MSILKMPITDKTESFLMIIEILDCVSSVNDAVEGLGSGDRVLEQRAQKVLDAVEALDRDVARLKKFWERRAEKK